MAGNTRGTLGRVALLFTVLGGVANALPSWGKYVEWTGADVAGGDLASAVRYVAGKTGLALTTADFATYEDRQLATSHFLMYAQQAGSTPIRSASIRLWLNRETGKTVRGEAFVTTPPSLSTLPSVRLDSGDTVRAIDRFLATHGEKSRKRLDWRDYYENGRFVRVVRVTGSQGRYELELDATSGNTLKSKFEEFPQADTAPLSVKLFPVYEEVEGTGEILSRVPTTLDNLLGVVSAPTSDPLESIRGQHFTEAKYDPLFGATPEGQAQGFWSMPYVRSIASALFNAVPTRDNTFAHGLVLEGKYVTVSLHPLVKEAYPGLSFEPGLSTIMKPDWKQTQSGGYEMIPYIGLRGKPVVSQAEALARPAHRDPKHDPKTYIEDGFDELQVYWSVDHFMASLRAMGFGDPDLSTRPFNAILFDPDITYRDNAFYTDDTINFTTYSPDRPNYARHNPTIWHELGHGIMDRLMGDVLRLDDTGGLSEGMADFMALLVIEHQTGGTTFPGKKDLRIFNRTGYFLTNEVHDDGEAYGGSLADFLYKAIARDGRAGLVKVTDLTLEAMRFARNHPGLTAQDWFARLLFADSLGSQYRRPGELGGLLREALASRNFPLGQGQVAKFELKNGDTEVLSSGPGSRNTPIVVSLGADDTARATLNVKLESGVYAFHYPVTVEVGLNGGPLQGSIAWENEAAAPFRRTIAKDGDTASFDVAVTGKCDAVNRPDGSCVDFAYVKILEEGQALPVAKKRFYYQVRPKRTR